MRTIPLFVTCLLLAGARPKSLCADDAKAKDAPAPFVICYHPKAPVKELQAYDLCVVDSAYPADAVAALVKQKKTVLGYLSLGKIHKDRPFLPAVQKLKVGLEKDQEFQESFRVDVADPKWHGYVTKTLVPDMKKKGFSGLFLDDLDDIQTRKLEKDAVSLIAAIRKVDPHLKLMANRGLEFLPKFAADVDYVLLESCYAQKGKLRPEGDPAWALDKLNAGVKQNEKLVGVAVDYYADKAGNPTKEQQALIEQVRVLHAKNGLRSCVSTADLMTVPSLPKANLPKK